MFFPCLGSGLIFFLSIQAHVGQVEGILTPFKQTHDFVADEGYIAEKYKVMTVDGFVLNLFRIPCDPAGPSMELRRAILLMPGLGQSSDQWVQSGSVSLPYLLANEGYDVWMGNFRGSEYGALNIHHSITSEKFWDYSFHEHGVYDLPAIIDYVLKWTEQPDLIYLGHSKGTTSFFVLLSLLPEYNNKISLGIMYAPVMDLKGTQSLPFVIGIDLYKTEITESIMKSLGIYTGFSFSHLSKNIRFLACNKYSFLKQFCWDVAFIACGFDYSLERNLTHPGQIFSHVLGVIGAKNFLHFVQTGQSGRFAQYDHGSKNMEIYGRLTPPRYPVENIKAPLLLTYADNDLVATKKMFKNIVKRLQTPYDIYYVSDEAFNHADYPLATEPELVSIPVINYIKEFFGTV